MPLSAQQKTNDIFLSGVFQTKRRKCIKFLQFAPLVGNCDGTEKLSVVIRKKYVYNRNVKNNCESKTGGNNNVLRIRKL